MKLFVIEFLCYQGDGKLKYKEIKCLTTHEATSWRGKIT